MNGRDELSPPLRVPELCHLWFRSTIAVAVIFVGIFYTVGLSDMPGAIDAHCNPDGGEMACVPMMHRSALAPVLFLIGVLVAAAIQPGTSWGNLWFQSLLAVGLGCVCYPTLDRLANYPWSRPVDCFPLEKGGASPEQICVPKSFTLLEIEKTQPKFKGSPLASILFRWIGVMVVAMIMIGMHRQGGRRRLSRRGRIALFACYFFGVIGLYFSSALIGSLGSDPPIFDAVPGLRQFLLLVMIPCISFFPVIFILGLVLWQWRFGRRQSSPQGLRY